MKVQVVGKELKVTDAINDYVERKLERIDKYFEDASAEVTVKTEKNEQIAEVMVNANGDKYRAEAEEKDLYASIDKVSDKIERQIRKNKTRMSKKVNKEFIKDFALDFEVPEEEENNNKIVKRKIIENKPMSEEEAVLQMELIGHEFFAFKNVDTGDVNIVYKRKDGDYGIMELK